MVCSSCGTLLPPKVASCPQCGASVSSFSKSPVSSYDPTTPAALSGSDDTTVLSRNAHQGPMTPYGSDPYAAPPPPPPPIYGANPYGVFPQDPYYTPLQAPPPARKRGARVGLFVGGVLLVLLLIGGGLFAFLLHSPAKQAAGSFTFGTGTLVLSDPLQDNSRGYKWDEAVVADHGGQAFCGFRGGAYHLAETARVQQLTVCGPEAKELTLGNFAYEVELTITQATRGTFVGLTLRYDLTQSTGYLFAISTNGEYVLRTFDGREIERGTNGAINKGLNQTNLVGIVANGTTLSMYVNNELLDSRQDSAYSRGQLGVFVVGSPVDVSVGNAKVWTP